MNTWAADIIVAGHICLDVIPAIPEKTAGLLIPGKLIDVGPALTSTGGAVSNTGLALHRLGVATKLMGKIGDDWFGDAIVQALARSGERLVSGMIQSPGGHSSYTIVINPPCVDRIFLHCTGTNDTFAAADVQAEDLEVSIVPDKGTEIMEYLYKPRDLDFMWLTEKGIQNPAGELPASADSQFAYFDNYSGGWQEIFPNGAVPSTYLGARYGQHGEVSHMKWDNEITEDTQQSVAVKFTIKTRMMPFQLTKTISLKSNSTGLAIKEQVTNLSTVDLQYMWGQHIALGKPFLEPGCRIELPDGLQVIADPLDIDDNNQEYRVARGMRHEWPRVQSPQGETVDLSVLPPVSSESEIVYITGFRDQAWYRVTNDRLGAGIEVKWDASESIRQC
ncbi:PfkB family carbohydrate kinase [Paenibacillus filicis]|uniref:PfkB family carbohydrate kinase n=1 Tax=Paenibacillus gyeongsangnamensis TaxID=3388067 RepID=A0ABT4Q4I1_9BACL|nr:PfkB family carbohydrate kinase [Paenibacillus filicis]MCZ8511739.1 PfkB family carbohydrate kinase [Paenibacillus filicis]